MKDYVVFYFDTAAVSTFELSNRLNAKMRDFNAKLVAVDNGMYIFERELVALEINKVKKSKDKE